MTVYGHEPGSRKKERTAVEEKNCNRRKETAEKRKEKLFSTLILQVLRTCNLGLTEALRALSAP